MTTGADDEPTDVISGGGSDAPRRPWAGWIVALVVVGGLAWVSWGQDDEPSDAPTAGPTGSASRDPDLEPGVAVLDSDVEQLDDATQVTVPRAGDVPQDVGAARLGVAGLRAGVRDVLIPCWPAGWVVDQSPAPGELLEAGDVVTLTVTNDVSARQDCPIGVATDNDRAIVGRFVAFAQHPDEGDPLPWGDQVEVLLPDRPVLVMDGSSADEAGVWRGPAVEAVIALGGAPVVQSAGVGRCEVPSPFESVRRLAISASRADADPAHPPSSCQPGDAANLYLDLQGFIVGVELPAPGG